MLTKTIRTVNTKKTTSGFRNNCNYLSVLFLKQ